MQELQIALGVNFSPSFYFLEYYSSEFTPKKTDDEVYNEKVRILQDNLVFINGLPSDKSQKQLLETDVYFGRYGKITKTILNPPYPYKKGTNYQAYVTYESDIDASIAIVALDGLKLADRPLKVSFGTTKYCSHFLKGIQCTNFDCFYLHKIDKKRQVVNGDTRNHFKDQNNDAIDKLCMNLNILAERILDSDLENVIEGFPSLTEVVDFMIESEIITKKQINEAFISVKKQRSQLLSVQLKLNKKNQSEVNQLAIQNPKLVKSSSHSTMATPSKDSVELQIQQFEQKAPEVKSNSKTKQLFSMDGKENKKILENNSSPLPVQNPKEVLTPKKLSVEINDNEVDSEQIEYKLEQKIEKLIIKEILKNGNSDKIKSRFIANAVSNKEECNKIKGIVQKFLIAQK